MIWGSAKSYIVSGVNTITLNHSLTDFDILKNEDVRHRSILTGVKSRTRTGDYSEFNITVFLWRESNPSSKFTSLMALEGNEVTFYFEGSTEVITCYVNSVRPYYYRNKRDYDVCILTLTPDRYITFTNIGLLNEDYETLLNQDGEPLRNEGVTITL